VNSRIPSLFSVIFLSLTLSSSADSTGPSAKNDGKNQEIAVTLFGQPCAMSGPFARPLLSLLHEISPEKISPDLTVAQMKKIRTKTGEIKGMPMVIEQYRDHLRKRLSAKITLEETIEQAKKANPAEAKRVLDAFFKNAKENISPIRFPGFQAEVQKAFSSAGNIWSAAFVAILREKYEEVIQPDTEEEFHKAIRVAKIQYVCVFDDGDSHSEGEE
jgi:hypothetical protein